MERPAFPSLVGGRACLGREALDAADFTLPIMFSILSTLSSSCPFPPSVVSLSQAADSASWEEFLSGASVANQFSYSELLLSSLLPSKLVGGNWEDSIFVLISELLVV